MTKRRGAAPLLLIALGAAGGLAAALVAVDVDAGGTPTEVKWVAGFLAGAALVLHVIKEVRYLVGHPPRRRTDDNLIQEVGSINKEIGEMRTDYSALTQIVSNLGKEIDRLRDINDGMDDRISRAMSKVASQTQTLTADIQDRMEVWQKSADLRLLALEQRRR